MRFRLAAIRPFGGRYLGGSGFARFVADDGAERLMRLMTDDCLWSVAHGAASYRIA